MNQKIFHTPPPNKGLGSVNRLTFIINTPLQYITQQINHFFAGGGGCDGYWIAFAFGAYFRYFNSMQNKNLKTLNILGRWGQDPLPPPLRTWPCSCKLFWGRKRDVAKCRNLPHCALLVPALLCVFYFLCSYGSNLFPY